MDVNPRLEKPRGYTVKDQSNITSSHKPLWSTIEHRGRLSIFKVQER